MSLLRLAKAIIKMKTKKKFPIEVMQTITAKCNLNCKYCIYPMKKTEMTTVQIKNAIKNFADEGTIGWSISGGEPLLRPDLKEVIEYAKDCGISRVKVLTNGLLFKHKLDILEKADEVVFSLDGPKEVHESVRGPNTFDRVVEAMNIAKNEGFNFCITTVVSKANIANDFYGIRYLFDLGSTIGCKVNFQPVYKINFTERHLDNYTMSQQELFSAMSLIKELALASDVIKYPPQIYDIFIDYALGKSIDLKCFAGKSFCHLSPEGLISPSFIMKQGENIDGLSVGFVNAFYQLQHQHDNSCYTFCLPGMDMIYLFNLDAIKKHMRTIMNMARVGPLDIVQI